MLVAETDAELVAGHARLAHGEQCAADLQPVADAQLVFVQAGDAEVLAELAPVHRIPAQRFAPVGVMIGGIGVHRLVRAAVVLQVGLTVALEVAGTDAHRPGHRTLEDARLY